MRIATLTFSVLSYIFFLGIFTYLVWFVGGPFLSDYLPFLADFKTVDGGTILHAETGLNPVILNLFLLMLFGVQHSVMARKSFKAKLTRLVPEAAERSIFVLATNLCILALFVHWQPMGGIVWELSGGAALFMILLFLAGATLTLVSTFLINHFELFGLQQAWHDFKGKEAAEPVLREPSLYKVTRHPLYLGILTVFWATPIMTTGHLLFAAIWSIYVFIGISYEERDLIDTFGDRYHDYMNRVPQLLPVGRRK